MLKKMLKRLKKDEKGFTLIELLAVIVILAVIAVIAVPLIGNIINNTRDDADLATARQLHDAARLYVTGELGGDYAAVATNGVSFNDMSPEYIPANSVIPSTKDPLTNAIVRFDANGSVQSVSLDGDTDAEFNYNAAAILGD
ncbi:type II secretion system protein [Paenibacillus sp. ATY16]|uniref:type II secretion system protein n=1 Tax=Paenibacillus sp. ATY16 TaxID=1759312 RepID=UPI00200D6C23|nr:type II secretion system protein [Paenibacillus sp. ATY16]MCK9857108.1 type II secretion system GspH family protein [Paenibacillus sp. ATY16]